MNILTAVMAAGLLVLVGCNFDHAAKNKRQGAAPGLFEAKKQCAAIGWQYYQRERAEFERMLGHKRVWPTDEDDGPYCAYSPDRDTCLVSWESTSTVERPDHSFSRSTYGYLYDALTGELVAHYSVTKGMDGKVMDATNGSVDSFKRTRKSLMGFDPQ